MHNQFKTQKFKHLMLAMGPRDLNSAPYSPVHCSSHSMTSFQSSALTKLPVLENSQLFAQHAHSARYAPQMSSVLYLTNNIGPTSVGVNTFSTIVLLTVITKCYSGALLATQHTHFCLILCLILRATTERTAAQCVPYTTRARHCNIVGGLSKCHSFFQ